VSDSLLSMFSLQGKVAVVTGGTGVLGGAIARGLATAGAKIAILGRRASDETESIQQIRAAGGEAIALAADVMNIDELVAARNQLIETWGRVDILVNAAGGNFADSLAVGDRRFFDISKEAMDRVINLNLQGTIYPSQVFGELMAEQGSGSIINISSASAGRPLTRAIGYSAAKSAIDNFTRWLAVDLASKYGAGLRVNAIMPGFFLGEQNRAMMVNPDGTPTPRGEQVIAHTPMGRFGEPDELVGAAIWLCSDSARFVTGAIVPVDGGFTAWNGV
jgi:NAD(P)-dependent dehydrogenase (short-subunit alcohol dehydrogenase family)